MLGSQHSAPGGDRKNFPPASVRSAGAADVIAKHDVEILGTQELQDDQLAALLSRTGFAAYPGLEWGVKETDNSILYDADRFEFVSGSKFIIPFMGRPRPQPILRLKDRATGGEFYVVNTHPSAHDGQYLTERRQGQDTLVGIVNQLKASGLPVLVTGDMNDREEFYCRVVPPAGHGGVERRQLHQRLQPAAQPDRGRLGRRRRSGHAGATTGATRARWRARSVTTSSSAPPHTSVDGPTDGSLTGLSAALETTHL